MQKNNNDSIFLDYVCTVLRRYNILSLAENLNKRKLST